MAEGEPWTDKPSEQHYGNGMLAKKFSAKPDFGKSKKIGGSLRNGYFLQGNMLSAVLYCYFAIAPRINTYQL
jgi:hypothetical protein